MSQDLPPDGENHPIDQLPPPPRSVDEATMQPDRRRRVPMLVRNTTDRYLAGIAGSIGLRARVDPFFVRIGLVGATLLLARDNGPYAIVPVGYFVGWLILPTDAERSLIRRIRHRLALQEIAGAVALLVLGLVVMDRPSLVWAGVLLGAAVMLLSDHTAADPAEPAAGRTEDPAEAAPDDERSRAATWGRSLRGAIGPRELPTPLRPPRVRRSPALWPLTGALLLAYGFGCVALDNLLEPGLDPGIAVNGALLIIGGVIALSGWRGRALLTSLLVLPLVPPWLAFSMVDTPRFADSAQLSDARGPLIDGQILEQSRGYGGLVMRLDRYQYPEGGAVTAKAELTAGQVDIWVPKEADLHIVGRVGLGRVDVYEERGYWNTTSEPLVDWGLDRRYDAVGRRCWDSYGSIDDLRNTAEWSQVAVPLDAIDEDIADAIESAGFPRPVKDVDGPRIEHEVMFEHDEFGNPLDDSGEPPSLQPVQVWAWQTNDNGGLCSPVPPPQNPTTITIDATVGLGNLKVHRV